MTHHPSAASLRLHGARLLFPPVATLLFLVLTEYIARGALSGDTFVQYIVPHPEAYLLAWGLLFPRLDGGGLAHPLRPAGHPPVGPAGLSAPPRWTFTSCSSGASPSSRGI